ncbi:ATPase [Solibacillus sp. R5-41]|uniref:ATPase n=1 Tax=Solibacillus sp. R5-41 TaxID=2048654 RepID=UPI000C127F46|nr:ATPase [Solibacillus sp. R5-41]ATP39005.1 ATPase [Solibacillus sp. R5-41]
MYIKKYVQVKVNGQTFYREKNIMGYYDNFQSQPVKSFEIVEVVKIDVDEIHYLLNQIQDVNLRSIIRHYIAYLEKISVE